MPRRFQRLAMTYDDETQHIRLTMTGEGDDLTMKSAKYVKYVFPSVRLYEPPKAARQSGNPDMENVFLSARLCEPREWRGDPAFLTLS